MELTDTLHAYIPVLVHTGASHGQGGVQPENNRALTARAFSLGRFRRNQKLPKVKKVVDPRLNLTNIHVAEP